MEYLIFSDNQKMIFNYDFFKDKYENGNLKNAEIFAEIFKLKKTVFMKNEIKYYNPQNPKEDYKQLYNWTFDMSYKSKEYLKHTQISAGDNYTYYRVLK